MGEGKIDNGIHRKRGLAKKDEEFSREEIRDVDTWGKY